MEDAKLNTVALMLQIRAVKETFSTEQRDNYNAIIEAMIGDLNSSSKSRLQPFISTLSETELNRLSDLLRFSLI